MPIELEGFENPHMLIEYRGIRAGEKGDKAPIKTPLRVRMPNRNRDKKFDPDIKVMQAAASRLEINLDEWHMVREVPVLLFGDKIIGEDGAIFIERALYTPLSATLTILAAQWHDTPDDSRLPEADRGVPALPGIRLPPPVLL